MKSLLKYRKLYKLIVLIGIVLICSSCGFKDIDKRIFVVAVGVDKPKDEGKQYRVTLKLAIPLGSAKSSPKPEYTYLSEDSDTIAQAVNNLQAHIDKDLEFGHTKVIIFGESMLENDMNEVIDFFNRRRDIQQTSWVAIGKPNAEDVLKTKPAAEMAGANVLFNTFSGIGTESPSIITTYFYEFRRELEALGVDAVLPILETNEKKDTLIINKANVLKDKKGALELNPEQAETLNVLSDRSKKLNFEVKKDDLHFTLFITKLEAKYDILTDPSPVIKLNVKMSGSVQESKTKLSMKELEKYSKMASEEYKKKAEALLNLFQENKVDPIGFGLRYYATRRNHGQNDWDKIYPDVKFDVSVKVDVLSTGSIQ